MLPSEFPRFPTDLPVSVSWCLETSLLRLPGTDLHPYLFCLSFYLLYFVIPPFEYNGLPFWVPDVLCQHSEVLLWNFLSVQMFIRWICGGESSLPVLFFHYLRTTPYCTIINMTKYMTVLFFILFLKFIFLSYLSLLPSFVNECFQGSIWLTLKIYFQYFLNIVFVLITVGYSISVLTW